MNDDRAALARLRRVETRPAGRGMVIVQSRGMTEASPVGSLLLALGWPATIAVDMLLIVALWASLGRLAAPVARVSRWAAVAMLATPAILNMRTLL